MTTVEHHRNIRRVLTEFFVKRIEFVVNNIFDTVAIRILRDDGFINPVRFVAVFIFQFRAVSAVIKNDVRAFIAVSRCQFIGDKVIFGVINQLLLKVFTNQGLRRLFRAKRSDVGCRRLLSARELFVCRARRVFLKTVFGKQTFHQTDIVMRPAQIADIDVDVLVFFIPIDADEQREFRCFRRCLCLNLSLHLSARREM